MTNPAAIARGHMAAAKIERDVRLSDLTDEEIDMLIEAVGREAEVRGEERERCARVAESYRDEVMCQEGEIWIIGQIAATIRSSPPAGRGD